MKNIHWPAIGAALATLSGVLMSPVVLGILPAPYAAGVVIGGSLIQAFTKPVPKAEPVVSAQSGYMGGSGRDGSTPPIA